MQLLRWRTTAARRAAAGACAAVLLLAGCSYGSEERGLFPTAPVRSAERPTARSWRTPPPTNPELPVAGERLWVSGTSEVPIRVQPDEWAIGVARLGQRLP